MIKYDYLLVEQIDSFGTTIQNLAEEPNVKKIWKEDSTKGEGNRK